MPLTPPIASSFSEFLRYASALHPSRECVGVSCHQDPSGRLGGGENDRVAQRQAPPLGAQLRRTAGDLVRYLDHCEVAQKAFNALSIIRQAVGEHFDPADPADIPLGVALD